MLLHLVSENQTNPKEGHCSRPPPSQQTGWLVAVETVLTLEIRLCHTHFTRVAVSVLRIHQKPEFVSDIESRLERPSSSINCTKVLQGDRRNPKDKA